MTSTRTETARRRSRKRCGMINSVGTSVGKCRKTGSNAVVIGIASSRLDGWGLNSIAISFVVIIRVKSVAKSKISM